MRRKLKSDSTMKTITYGLFIYVCLTTFNGISASPPEPQKGTETPLPTHPKCDLQNIIKKSKYVVDCLSTTTDAALPELDFETRSQYLCTGIFETVKKICETNRMVINETAIPGIIEDLQSQIGTNRTKFCTQLVVSISRPSENSMITSTAYPNMIKFNNNLIPQCNIYCYDNQKIAVHPLCVMLYWVNDVLLGLKKPDKPDPNSLQHKETTERAKGNTLSSSTAQPIPDKLSHTKIETKTINKPQEESNSSITEKEIIPKATLANSSAGNSDSTQKGLPLVKNGVADPPETLAKIDTTVLEEIAKDVTEIKASDETGDQNKDPLVPGTANAVPGHTEPGKITQDKSHDGNALDGESVLTDSRGDVVGGEINYGEDIDRGFSDGHVPPIGANDEANTAVYKHDEEKKLVEKSEEPKTDQGSVYPQDHTLVNSGGPPDPPQHFFAYFMAISLMCIICYIGYHKKHKIMGIIFEGRKSRGGRGRKRPNTAGYRKLDCNLEEAVTSQCDSN